MHLATNGLTTSGLQCGLHEAWAFAKQASCLALVLAFSAAAGWLNDAVRKTTSIPTINFSISIAPQRV
jgi:hypothetical protein